jgi:hypothetical protein
MIRKSCLLASMLFALWTAGCDGACTLKGCQDGLVIQFAGRFDQTATYEIAVATTTHVSEVVTFARCLVTPNAVGLQLFCTSQHRHTENGTTLQLPESRVDNLTVTISSGGGVIGEQRFDNIVFESREINGPGCGVCTNASVQVTIPG